MLLSENCYLKTTLGKASNAIKKSKHLANKVLLIFHCKGKNIRRFSNCLEYSSPICLTA